jgi:muramoyltetrapeptide carboxypeptidase LdcA involved in peptidoglycan recycling
MKQFIPLPKLVPGDQVAVISPSAGLPAIFPWVQDLGLQRLKDIFSLAPVEYPTTRILGAPLQDRARDIMAAFADPSNKAVFTSIGGDDQIKLLKYLDPQVFLDNPKPFFGYSDNTHLHNFLWNLGIPSYYGCAIMTQLAFQGDMNQMTIDSLKHALFDSGEYELAVADQYCDEGLDWSDKENLTKTRKMEPNDGLVWDGATDAEGILWGGCVESLIVQASSGIYLPKSEDLAGTILCIETAEDIPDHWVIDYLLTGFGERGWFNSFQAVLVGRPKAWEFDKRNNTEAKATYRQLQRETVSKIVREYNKSIPIVQNVDFGHTDPQVILPLGGKVKINSSTKQITLCY